MQCGGSRGQFLCGWSNAPAALIALQRMMPSRQPPMPLRRRPPLPPTRLRASAKRPMVPTAPRVPQPPTAQPRRPRTLSLPKWCATSPAVCASLLLISRWSRGAGYSAHNTSVDWPAPALRVTAGFGRPCVCSAPGCDAATGGHRKLRQRRRRRVWWWRVWWRRRRRRRVRRRRRRHDGRKRRRRCSCR